MDKLRLVSLSTETEKVVKKGFSFPVALITPQPREITVKGIKTLKVSSGSLWLNKESADLLSLISGSKVTISEAETGLFIYKSSDFEVNEQYKKKLTRTNILRLSEKNISKIYTDNSLPKTEAWFFQLEERLIDLPGVEDAKVCIFIPLEKRA